MFFDYRFDILWLRLRLIYVFWLPIWYLVITTQDIKSVIRKHILSGVVITRYQIGNQKTYIKRSGNQKTYRFDILWLPLRLLYVFWLPIWYLVITTPFNICFLLNGVVITRYQIGNQKTYIKRSDNYKISNQ
jgi:hypothetical protein